MKVDDRKPSNDVETKVSKEPDDWRKYRLALTRRRLKRDGKDIHWYVENKSARLWAILREFGVNERLLTNRRLVRHLTKVTEHYFVNPNK